MKKFSAKEYFYLFLAILPIVYLLYWVVRLYLDIPYYDQWDFVPLLKKFYEGQLGLGELWAQHNEHRIFFPKIIMLVLAWLSGWNIAYEISFNMLLGFGIFASLMYMFARTQRELNVAAIAWPVPIISIMVFSMNQMGNWLWGWQMQIFMCVLSFIVGIILLTGTKVSTKNYCFALICGVVAIFSFASGLGFWIAGSIPLIFTSDNKDKTPRLVIWGITTVLVIFLYFLGYVRPLYSPSMWTFIHHPIIFGHYVFSFVGGFLMLPPRAIFAGIVGVFMFLLLCWVLKKRVRLDNSVLLPYVSLGFFSLITAAITGVGRVGLGIDQAGISRYKTFSMLFWIPIIVMSYIILNRRERVNRGTRVLAVSLVVIIAVLSVHSSFQWTNFALKRQERLNRAKEVLLAGKDDPILFFLHHNPVLFKERIEVLKKHRLNIWR